MSTSIIETIQGDLNFGDDDKISLARMTNMRDLNIIVGMNGIGKTIVLKTSWYITYNLFIYKLYTMLAPDQADDLFINEVPKIFKATYDTEDNFGCDVEIEGTLGSKYRLRLGIENEKVTRFDLDIEDPEKFAEVQMGLPQFNSKHARTFNAYLSYVKLMERLGIKQFETHDQAVDISEEFKLYDILWFEKVRGVCKTLEEEPLPIDDPKLRQLKSMLDAAMDLKEVKAFGAKDNIPFVIMESGKTKKFHKLGSGTQAILMLSLIADFV